MGGRFRPASPHKEIQMAGTGINATLIKGTEFAGDYKIVQLTFATVSAADVLSITQATHGISEITAIIGTNIFVPKTTSAGIASAGASFSGLDVTVTTLEADGTAGAVFGQQVGVTLLGTTA